MPFLCHVQSFAFIIKRRARGTAYVSEEVPGRHVSNSVVPHLCLLNRYTGRIHSTQDPEENKNVEGLFKSLRLIPSFTTLN